MYCYGRMWAPKFLGNGEVTSKSIYERARAARKPVRTGVRRAGVHQEVGSGPSLAEGGPQRGQGRRLAQGRGHGGPVAPDTWPSLSGPPSCLRSGVLTQPHGGTCGMT